MYSSLAETHSRLRLTLLFVTCGAGRAAAGLMQVALFLRDCLSGQDRAATHRSRREYEAKACQNLVSFADDLWHGEQVRT